MTSNAVSRRRLEPVPTPLVRSAFRAVDGNRSPWYAALKRKADLADNPSGGYRLTLAEHRQALIPWLRIPVFTYWRRQTYFGHDVPKLEISVRVFLETGHMPACWHL